MRPLDLYRASLSTENWQTAVEPLPTAVAQWLWVQGSLTEKLKTICDCFQVEVIGEQWQAVENSPNSAKQWVREVILKCGETDWIFAQTILPEQTINAVALDVLNLGNQPIGLWLFPQSPERLSLAWQYDPENALYARRSTLQLKGFPLEITELFLTDFPFEKHYDPNHSAL